MGWKAVVFELVMWLLEWDEVGRREGKESGGDAALIYSPGIGDCFDKAAIKLCECEG